MLAACVSDRKSVIAAGPWLSVHIYLSKDKDVLTGCSVEPVVTGNGDRVEGRTDEGGRRTRADKFKGLIVAEWQCSDLNPHPSRL